MTNLAQRDAYLINKFSRLQAAAQHAQAEIAAIPVDAAVEYEFDAVRCAIAPVERCAQMLVLIEGYTAAGRLAIERAEAWRAGAGLDTLLEPLEIIDEHRVPPHGSV